jgi:hypothetical protein
MCMANLNKDRAHSTSYKKQTTADCKASRPTVRSTFNRNPQYKCLAGYGACNEEHVLQAVIIDTPSPTSDPLNRARLLSDVYMMVQHNGKERDQDQWQRLLSAAGFALSRIVPTRSIFCMVEAKPVAGWLSAGQNISKAMPQPPLKAISSGSCGLSLTAFPSPVQQHEE